MPVALNYQIALGSVWWDNSYSHVRRFGSRAEQQTFFNGIVNWSAAIACNFNVTTLLNTTITFNYSQVLNLSQLMMQNYAIIKDNTPNATIPYYYYFIKSARQNCGTQLSLELELDIFQTFYIDIDFNNAQIRRAHISRWATEQIPNRHIFNMSADTQLIKNEKLLLEKHLISKQKVNIEYVNGSSAFNNAMPKLWAYFFLSENSDIIFGIPSIFRISENGMSLPYIVLAVPVDKPIIVLQDGRQYSLFIEMVLYHLKNNNRMADILSYKLSPVAPFTYQNSLPDYITIAGEYIVISLPTTSDTILDNTTFQFLTGDLPPKNVPVLNVEYQPSNRYTQSVFIPQVQSDFTFASIPTDFDIAYEPKRIQSIMTEIRIYDYYGNYISYDPFKMGTNNIKLAINELITPDITRGFLFFIGNNSAIYTTELISEYFGLFYTNDTSILVSVNQLDSFLANNKNFFEIAENVRDKNTRKSIIQSLISGAGAAASFMSGNIIGGVLGTVGAAYSLYSTSQENELDITNKGLTLDQLANAPETLNNSNNNILLPYIKNAGEVGFYIELWQGFQADIETACQYLHKYGYTVDLVGDIHDYDNIRRQWNYVQADITNVMGIPVSNAVRQRFAEVFSRGVTFWNVDQINYAGSNWER